MLIGKRRNFPKRCVDVFTRANQALRAELGDLLVKHGADGLLQSGSTIRLSIAAFEKHTLTAVDSLEREFALLVQSRGREWKRAMDSIDEAIHGQLHSAKHLLERPFRIAAGEPGKPASAGSAIARAVDDELRGVGKRLLEWHAAFSDGWTAPPGKAWHERHPLLYAALAAVGGGLLTAAVGAFSIWGS
jgi:hypothetical protein